jgi:hypothetical protein
MFFNFNFLVYSYIYFSLIYLKIIFIDSFCLFYYFFCRAFPDSKPNLLLGVGGVASETGRKPGTVFLDTGGRVPLRVDADEHGDDGEGLLS